MRAPNLFIRLANLSEIAFDKAFEKKKIKIPKPKYLLVQNMFQLIMNGCDFGYDFIGKLQPKCAVFWLARPRLTGRRENACASTAIGSG